MDRGSCRKNGWQIIWIFRRNRRKVINIKCSCINQLYKNLKIVIFADHGLHMQGPLRAFNLSGGENEVYLPSLFISLPF